VRRVLTIVFVVVIGLVGWHFVRNAVRPSPPRPDAEAFAHAEHVKIVRDVYGVPHIFGKSDADTAFGLAYAHSEDDWPTIQAVMAASTGRLSLLYASKKAAGNDWYVGLVRVREQVAEQYESLAPDYRAVLEGYARGLNFYAWKHPEESDGRLFPLTGRDIAAGFAHKIPFMLDVPLVIGELIEGGPKKPPSMPGSNAHAVAGFRSPDGVTRLNVNSHQPWEGPVSWYEAHVVSEEGWNMTGGLFPGAPFVLHGHNERLGWAHTVNSPDLVDVYELPPSAVLEQKEVPITIDTGLFDLHVSKAAHWSALHGAPVVKTEKGAWAIRYAGIGRALKTGEQWFRMNKAKDLAQWKDAMRIQALPMFNTVFADSEHILYVYNALYT
jgi:acyl-homoserine-lactone acylase